MKVLDELYEQASRLPEKERAALAGLLVESLDAKPGAAIENAWRSEVTKRIKELDSGLATPVSAEKVHARLDAIVKSA